MLSWKPFIAIAIGAAFAVVPNANSFPAKGAQNPGGDSVTSTHPPEESFRVNDNAAMDAQGRCLMEGDCTDHNQIQAQWDSTGATVKQEEDKTGLGGDPGTGKGKIKEDQYIADKNTPLLNAPPLRGPAGSNLANDANTALPPTGSKGPRTVPGPKEQLAVYSRPPVEILTPTFAPAHVPAAEKVQRAVMTGNFKEAVLTSERIILEDPESPTGYWLSGWVQNKAGNRDEAIEVVERGLQVVPEDKGLQSLEKLFKRKASDMAQKEIDKRRNSLLGTLHSEDAAGEMGPGFTLDKRNFSGGATAAAGVQMAGMVNPAMFSQAARTAQTHGPAADPLALASTKGGLSALRVGDPKAAASHFTEAIRRDPKNPAAWRLRAMAFHQAGRHEQAVSDANRALQLDSTDHWAFLVRAKALTDIGQTETALIDIQAALELQPKSADAYATRARLHHKTGDHQKELDDMREAANLDPAFQDLFRQSMREAERLGTGTDAPVKPRRGTKNLIFGAFALLGLGLVGAAFSRRSGLTAITTTQGAEGVAGFDIVRKLGQGGMGEVWEATDRALQRRVAIKKLIPEIAGVARERQRFLKEARTVAALKHPGIIEIHQVVENNEDLYLVFEYVDGVSLDSVLADKGRLSLPEALEVLRQTAEALDFAHGRGVIHQDLKPANIMVENETVKVMDFGIARRVAETMGAVTRMEVVGTPSYMAPEQARGDASPETDVYALGATLYEMLSGRRPFTGVMSDLSKLEKAYAPLSRAVPGLPEAVDAVIDRALDPDPQKRFHSGREFFQALQAVAVSPPSRA